MSGRKLDPDERLIWQVVTKTVTPLNPKRKEVDRNEERASGSKSTPRETIPAPGVIHSSGRVKTKPLPADRSADRRLRRGRVEIDARIDLHGMTQAAARAALGRFLHSARSRGLRAVLVITGKGKAASRSRGPNEAAPGIIRRRFPEWLAEPELRHIVSGYAGAHRRHGGDGAFYVIIRKF